MLSLTFRPLGFFLVPAFLVLTDPVTFSTVWPIGLPARPYGHREHEDADDGAD